MDEDEIRSEISKVESICEKIVDAHVEKMRKIFLSLGDDVGKISDNDLDKACIALEKLEAQIKVLLSAKSRVDLELEKY